MSGHEDLDGGLLDPTGDDAQQVDAAGDPNMPELRFPDVDTFVAEYLAHAWGRSLRDTDHSFRWCPHWFDHPPVLDRLAALWMAYETLHAEGGTGPARWWRDHADPTLRALTDPKGPFARCTGERHQLPAPLPTARRDTDGVPAA